MEGPHRLSVADRSTVRMRQTGVAYAITSTVTAIEEDRLVEWQHPAGHRWRWELAEVTPGTTQVTEVFDCSTAKVPRVMELTRMTDRNARGVTGTLQQLADRSS